MSCTLLLHGMLIAEDRCNSAEGKIHCNVSVRLALLSQICIQEHFVWMTYNIQRKLLTD